LLTGSFDIPELGLYGVALDSLAASDSLVSFKLLYGTFQMRLHPAVLQMTGENRAWGPPVSLHLRRTPQPARPETLAVVVQRAGAAIHGTLYLPSRRQPVPAIVVAGGSVQTTRRIWEYRGWGSTLAARGIATLVYDRRGQGESTGDTTDVDLGSRRPMCSLSSIDCAAIARSTRNASGSWA
jgi:hypothetical protein